MGHTIYDQYGIGRNSDDISLVSKLEALKKKSGANPWPVVEACLKIWAKLKPKEWKAYLIELQDIKETRKKGKITAVSKEKKHGSIRRYLLDIPETVILMLRTLYTVKELPMNQSFFREFARRFPTFRITNKV